MWRETWVENGKSVTPYSRQVVDATSSEGFISSVATRKRLWIRWRSCVAEHEYVSRQRSFVAVYM